MKTKYIVLQIIFSLVIFLTVYARPSYAAILKLNPNTTSVPLNGSFTVDLVIDTEGEQVTSSDAIIKFNGLIISATTINTRPNGQEPFFPDIFQNITANELYIGASVIDPSDFRQGTGTIASITFRGNSEGTSDAVFDCTAGKTSDSNISKNDKNATDIIDCTRVVNGRYTVGSGITQPTTPPNVTTVPTPTPIRAGSFETTAGIALFGILLMGIGFITRLLTRSI